jgi:hypothetical protein
MKRRKTFVLYYIASFSVLSLMYYYLEMSEERNQSWNNDNKYNKEMREFSLMFENVFRSAGYLPHTAIHPHRFPLLGNGEQWTYLTLELIPEKAGRTPAGLQRDEHALDVLLALDLDTFAKLRFNFVRTNLFPVLFIRRIPDDPAEYKSKLGSEFDALNIPVYTFMEYHTDRIPMDVIMRRDHEESGLNLIAEDMNPSLSDESKTAAVQIYQKESKNKRTDSHASKNGIPRVVFDLLSNLIGDHHEKRAQNLLEEAGGLLYNPYLNGERAPDGYYFCNTATLKRLKEVCNSSLHTSYGYDRFFTQISEDDLFVLVALEAKATIDCLKDKLDPKYNYFLFRPASEPIRHLALVDGGRRSRFFITLLNLCVLEMRAARKLEESVSMLDYDILRQAREMGQKLNYGDTLIVYLASFSTETIRDLPHRGNNDRLLINTLCDLVRLVMKVPNAKRAARNECLSVRRAYYLNAIEVRFRDVERNLNMLHYQSSALEQSIVELFAENPTLDVIQRLQKDVIERKSDDEGPAAETCPQLLQKLAKAAKLARRHLDKKCQRQTRSPKPRKQTTVNAKADEDNERCGEKIDPFAGRMIRQKSLDSADESSAGGTHSDDENYKFGAEAE